MNQSKYNINHQFADPNSPENNLESAAIIILIRDGNNNKEEIKATTKIIVDNIPNSELGLKLENGDRK